jgi:MATE family multidrug resistance protein
MTAITDLAGSPPMPLARHISRTVQLAAPIVVARAAVLVMTVIDTAMTGWAGTEELAALGLGVAPQLTLQMIAIGFLQATPILAAQAIGSGRGQEAGIVLRSGLLHALGLGLAFIALSFLSAWFFRLTGQPEDVVTKAAAVSLAFSLGLPGMLLFVTCSMFLEATGRPKTAMTVLIVAALIDLPLNGIFALGWGGFIEPMGAVGAVGTSSVMRALAFLVTLGLLVRWEARLGDPRGVLDALRNWRERRPFGSRLRRIGIPIGLAQGVESAAFSAMVFLGGAISTQALAAHQATLSLLSLIYMSAVGIGGATAIRVGNAVGRGSAADLRLAGWSGIALAGAAALPFAAIMFLSPEWVATLFGMEGEALRLTAATIQVAGLVVTLDALMGGSLGALRGAGDVWVSFAIQSGAFWIAAVPIAAALGIGAGLGAPGLIVGILAGVTLSFALLALRFHAVTRRAVVPL